jgi:hypothetical protein
MTGRGLLVVAFCAALQTAAATEVVSGRITRVREDPTTGRVFVEVIPRPASLDCFGFIVANETYWFDADTVGGRALYAQVLSAYTFEQNVGTVQYVYVLGGGNRSCLDFATTSFERLSRVSTCAAFPCNAPVP